MSPHKKKSKTVCFFFEFLPKKGVQSQRRDQFFSSGTWELFLEIQLATRGAQFVQSKGLPFLVACLVSLHFPSLRTQVLQSGLRSIALYTDHNDDFRLPLAFSPVVCGWSGGVL